MGAAAPPATTMSAASPLPSRCGTRNRASDSGSATVADSPIARICGASRHSRARPERQQIAALGGDQRMQFVEHDALQRGKQKRRVVGRQQQRQLLGRGQQNIRRIAPLPLPPRHRRVAGAGLDLDRQPHLGDRRFQIARDIDRQRLQRRDVEGVQAAAALHAAAGGDDVIGAKCVALSVPTLSPPLAEEGSRASSGENSKAPPTSAEIPPASCRRRSARSAAPSGRRGPLPAAPADARAATSRAPRTSLRKWSGSRAVVVGRGNRRDTGRHAARAKPSRAGSSRARGGPKSDLAAQRWQTNDDYSVTGLSEISQSLPLKIEM